MLLQDDTGGLEVKSPTGWIEAPPVPSSFVCNIGDMLERMTGGLCSCWGKLGAPAPGPVELRLPPDPRMLASTPDYALMALGVRPKQARTIRRVAKYASRIEEAASTSMSAEAFAQRLAAIRGIGPWTIAYVQGTALGAPDALLLGDYNLPDTVAYLLAGEERASEERMVELLEPYRGHRFRVIRLVWMHGVTAPRRGPRQERL